MEQQQTTGREDARRFHVHTCLGAGGFGEVYKATMTSAGGVQHEQDLEWSWLGDPACRDRHAYPPVAGTSFMEKVTPGRPSRSTFQTW